MQLLQYQLLDYQIKIQDLKKYLIQDDKKISVKHLNGYLLDSRNIIVKNLAAQFFGFTQR